MSSFNHRINPLQPWQLDDVAAKDPQATWRWKCKHKGCDDVAEVVYVYDYVTGRVGRVTDRRQIMCLTHARAKMAPHLGESPVCSHCNETCLYSHLKPYAGPPVFKCPNCARAYDQAGTWLGL